MISPDCGRRLFAKEFEVLETAMAHIASGRYEDNALSGEYQALLGHYQQLLNLTRKVFKISDAQSSILAQREEEFRHLLDNVGQGVFTFGANLVVNREYSSECLRIFGRKIGKLSVVDLLNSDHQLHNLHLAEGLTRLWTVTDPAQRQASLAALPRLIYQQNKPIALDFKLITHESQDTLVMVVATDVTEKRQAEEKIAYLSYRDKLTDLYNRAYVETVLPSLQSPEHFPVSMMMADMNGLKLTNDVFGHAQGDLLLVSFTQILRSCLRPQDIVARWGGDEFVIILPATDSDACQKVRERIERAVAEASGLPIELSVALGWVTQQSRETQLADLFGLAESKMYKHKLLSSGEVRRKLVAMMEETLDSKCYEDPGHTQRTQQLALRFADYLGLSSDALRANLSLLASLHDIGKVAIPKEILGKRGALTEEEWEIIKSHSEIGYRMAQSLGEGTVAEAILAFHERWDGSGYPIGLAGEEIPLSARLLALVDVYDVMTHDRPYRSALSQDDALAEIRRNNGQQFDPQLAEQFLAMLSGS